MTHIPSEMKYPGTPPGAAINDMFIWTWHRCVSNFCISNCFPSRQVDLETKTKVKLICILVQFQFRLMVKWKSVKRSEVCLNICGSWKLENVKEINQNVKGWLIVMSQLLFVVPSEIFASNPSICVWLSMANHTMPMPNTNYFRLLFQTFKIVKAPVTLSITNPFFILSKVQRSLCLASKKKSDQTGTKSLVRSCMWIVLSIANSR